MKIGVIADTHMPRHAKKLPEALTKGLESVDLIIHAGDWQTLEVYEALKEIAPVEGVAGNVDSDEIIGKFGFKRIVAVGRFKIGVVHGHGTKKTTVQRAKEAFEDDDVDGIVFGHSHIPLYQREADLILFNPGSPTDKRRQPQFSYGIFEVDETIKAHHVYYDYKH